MNWTHNGLQSDLAAHLRATRDRVIWEDMQLGESGSPRPDVYSIPKTFQRFCPIAYEIKVSVADFRRDVTAGKWQSYLQFAAGVTFAVPQGLITKADVPPGCGLMVRGEDGWRGLKAPTLKALDGLPKKAWLKLIIDGIERQHREPQPRALNTWSAERDLRRKFGDTIGQLLHDVATAEGRLTFDLEEQSKRHQAALDSEDKRYRAEIERRSYERKHVDESLGELAAGLGLEPDASPSDVLRALRKARESISADAVVARLQGIINRIKNAVSGEVA